MEVEKILNKIVDFCNVKEMLDSYAYGSFRKLPEYSNRLKFLIGLVEELGIEYEVFTTDYEKYFDDDSTVYFHNLVLKGNSNRWISAHYDVYNEKSQNANDNSASVINAIAAKYLNPDINVVLLDAEEQPYASQGSKEHLQYLLINNYDKFKIEFILNLELTGLGRNIVISDNNGSLLETVKENFSVLIKNLPPNDSRQFRKKHIDSVCVSTYPLVNGEPNFDHFYMCHKLEDNLESISLEDMKAFVLNFLVPITKVELVKYIPVYS